MPEPCNMSATDVVAVVVAGSNEIPTSTIQTRILIQSSRTTNVGRQFGELSTIMWWNVNITIEKLN